MLADRDQLMERIRAQANELQEKDEEIGAFFSVSPAYLIVADKVNYLRVSESFATML